MTTMLRVIHPAAGLRRYLVLFLFSLTAIHSAEAQTCPSGNIVYVNVSVTGTTHDGTSWATAFTTLQDALSITKTCTDSKQIWVAKGTYYPDEGGNKTDNDRNASFNMKNNLALYGGFAGNETNLSNRDWKTNVTILSGDIDKNNVLDNANSYHVVANGSGINTTALLDGFIVTGGNGATTSYSGGMFNSHASPTVNNCIFSGNSASYGYGGGMCNIQSSPVITNCVFSGNFAFTGGGLYNGVSNAVITNCTFSGNNTQYGGGGIYNEAYSAPVIKNCIIWNNGDSANNTSASSITSDGNSTPTITYSLVQGQTPDGTGNVDGITYAANNNYPLFVKVINPNTAPTNYGNLQLRCFSPAINKGNNAGNTASKDLNGNARVFNNGIIDLGAYENQGGCCSGITNVIYVDSSAVNGNSDGSTWANAFNTLQDALLTADSCSGINQIWIAKGTYYPNEGGRTKGTQTATFQLKNNLTIYGGFAGNEISLYARNYSANVTILSGDIDKNNQLDGNNAYHVTTGSGTDGTALLDGFTITGGYNTTDQGLGAGMYNLSGSPVINNCIFSGNSAGNGGGMANETNSNPVITNCVFSGNSTNASGFGGAIYNGNSKPALTNCTISGNIAIYGGGVSAINSNPVIKNCIIWNNNDISGTGTDQSSVYKNSSSPVISHSLVQGYTITDANGNLDGKTNASNANYPLFIIPANPSAAPGNAGNLRLQCFSPAIDSGYNAADTLAKDLDNNARIFGDIIDLGAYEKQIACCPPANIVYVDSSAVNGRNDGSSWINAFTHLQDALAIATHCSRVNQVWVAKGKYYSNGTFHLKNKLAIYGGFAGNEASGYNLSQRNLAGNVTVLSADFSNTVVDGSFTDTTAVLDGFIITGGYGVGGAGMVNNAGSPTVSNCIFSGNLGAAASAGGMSNNNHSNPVITNCIFSGNIGSYGSDIGGTGAMSNDYFSNPVIKNCVFSGNSAASSGVGAMSNDYFSNPVITNCTFSGNSAGSYGLGCMFNSYHSSPVITNCTFSGNSTGKLSFGGGINNQDSSNPVITNCVFSGNKASYGGGIFNSGSYPVITNCIIWNNKDTSGTGTAQSSIFTNYNNTDITISYSLVQGQTPAGTGNLDGITNASNFNYPKFVTPVDPSTTPTVSGNLRLQCFSPAIDKGNDVVNSTTTDLDNNQRKVNTIDLGAYENQGGCTQPTFTGVSTSGSPSCQGSQITFTATVTSASSTVTTGGVTFTQGATILADSVAVDASGKATFSTDTLSAGAHTIVATYKPASSAFASSSNSVNQTVNARPTGSISGSYAYCSGSNTTTSLQIKVTGSGTINGTLSGNISFSGTAPVINVQVTPAATTTYTIASLSDSNCTAQSSDLTGSATVTINPVPSAPACGGNQTVCAQTPVQTLTATASTTSGNTITWYDAMTGGNVIASPILNKVGTVTYYAQSSNGSCTSATKTAVTLTIKATPTAPAVSVVNKCGSSTLTASNYTGSLLWSNNATTPAITVITSGTYYVTQTVNGCTSAPGSGMAMPDKTLTVTANNISANTGSNCNALVSFGKGVNVNTSGPATLTYKIGSKAITSPYTFPTGITTVTVSATNSCSCVSKCFTVTVTDKTAPIISCKPGATKTVTCGYYIVNGKEFDATATDNCKLSTLAYSVSGATCIYYNSCNTSLSGRKLNAGINTITWTATDASGNKLSCTTVVTVKKSGSSSLVAENSFNSLTTDAELSVKLSPVPARSNLMVSMNGFTGKILLQIFSSDGKQVKQQNWNVSSVNTLQQNFDVSTLAAGRYLLMVSDEKGNRKTEKFIISR